MASFDDITLVKEPQYPVHDYYCFINLFQKQAEKFKHNIYLRYEDLSSEGEIEVKTLTYGQVDLIATNLACDLYEKLGNKSVISVLEDHSVYYLIMLYTLYKLRIPVQMISARNSSAAVCSLLQQVNSDCLVYGIYYQHIKDIVSEENRNVECFPIPNFDLENLLKKPLNPIWSEILDQNFTEEDLDRSVTIVHSSGTTNMPKAVIWSNRFLMYFIQTYLQTFYKRKQFEFIEDENDILIGITPSYHMFGTYSNYHCILSGGSIYYFREFPPTAKHTIAVMKKENVTRLNAPPYFVNQIMHYMEETGDIQPFQNLKFLATGGAATPKKIDEFFLKNNINVLNMFSMSDAEKHTYLEHYDEDKYQLIVRKGSPFLATGIQTRENGDYATKDLVVKSKVIENGYNYVGRADDILVMFNGEKTNPLPMEDTIKSNPLVANCTVIGEGQQLTAALIELNFEAVKNYCLDTVIDKVHESIRKANEDAPSYSTILPEMVKIIPFSKHLVASDKGTVSRKRSIIYFQTEVDDMYAKSLTKKIAKRKMCHTVDSNVLETNVMTSVIRVLRPAVAIQKEVSLFKQGLNSLLSIQLQNYLSKDIYPVPQDFLYDYPTIATIVDYFSKANIVNKPKEEIPVTKKFNYQATTDILDKYLQSASKDLIPAVVTNYSDPNDDREHVVMLTGATGSLGSAILLKLLQNPKVKTVYALVRGNESTDLMGRIADSFRKRGYPESELYEAGRVQALPMNVEQEYLGLSINIYNKLKSETTVILSCAWLLDFNQPVAHYDSECIKGLYNMVKFANKEINPIHFHFISSVSATGAYGIYVPEAAMPNNPQVALPMGYGQSKFIVEQLFHYLVEKKNMPCYVHRVGQLCGDSNTGAWNTTEMYPLTLVGGGSYMKKMPDLDTAINWIPVNYAGNAIVDIMMNTATRSPKSIDETIFHIVNTNEISWSSLLTSMKECGMEFEVINPKDWVQEVSKDRKNPCYRLLGFYQKLFTSDQKILIRWGTKNTSTLAPSMKQAPNVIDMLPVYLKSWKSVKFYNP
ncbi:hypothetical protein INT48_002213 [Thamnidium elegans]|uniref:Uncharacterized protein n=1 Tax=Thamnidium elegans TaxID=101142 RepID=A0A8H7W2V8_9FUNG|nr:hypothetical protein INT48_002213 [Thamnidium elegans]